MKPVFGVAATGVIAFLLWKVLLIFLLPIIGVAAGLLFLVVKIVFLSVMICVAIWLFRRLARSEATPAEG